MAFSKWSSVMPGVRAFVLRALADAVGARREDIIAAASAETALTLDELAPEFSRMIGTLRQFADAIERGTWHVPVIDHVLPAGSPALVGPNHDIRRTLVPLGPIAVFGASNFPLAYGVLGGDTASALAAGCSVVVKEHPAHPRTGRLLATLARDALKQSNSIECLLEYVVNEDPTDYSVAAELVRHEAIRAVGFTGSKTGGTAIEKLARERESPIPVFAEMGSTNPVFITARAAAARGQEIARVLSESILTRYGQQCTRPGVVIVDTSLDHKPRSAWGEESRSFHAYETVIAPLRKAIASSPERDMLSASVLTEYRRRVLELMGVWRGSPDQPRVTGVVDDHFTLPVLFEVDKDSFAVGTFARDVFGPACVATSTNFTHGGARELCSKFEGQLCASIFHDGPDDPALADLLDALAPLAGRIVFNGVPTGVRVAPAMVHSGPYPACNRPDSTAVGLFAIQRWCRPVCYQNCPDALLPEELRDANPRGLLRLVNGQFSTRECKRP